MNGNHTAVNFTREMILDLFESRIRIFFDKVTK